MCGITGFVVQGWPEERLRRTAAQMALCLAHRGPDDEGTWVDAAAGIALGHRRLSILDLSPAGHQPMVSASGRHVLVFNGEIYNFADLRSELQACGVSFRGTSDTEVLLEAIDRWGLQSAVRRTNGMFALAVWDTVERTLSLARDRLGEKPLYYGWQGGAFLFASELKALRAHPNFAGRVSRDAVARYLSLDCVPAPASIYEGIAKLAPGTLLVLRPEVLNVLPQPEPYWSATDTAMRAGSGGVTAGELEALLADAVARRMVADVPLGALLSGGVDSSAVVALMQAQSSRPVRTFTIGFSEAGFDEAGHARAVAGHLGTDHTELYVTAGDAEAVIPRLPEMYDEPFADSSQIPTFLVCEMARRSLTVALSGDGGDEVFGGYNRYLWWKSVWDRSRRLPRPARTTVAAALGTLPPGAWDRVGRALRRVSQTNRLADGRLGERAEKAIAVLGADTPTAAYGHLVSHWKNREPLVLGATPADSPVGPPPLPTFVEQMMYLDLVGYLPDDILTKVDRASMAVSLEVRVPFLDHRVVEAAWRLPLSAKIAGGRGKLPLRRILDRYVPRNLIERPKSGFGVPIGEWLRGSLRPWAEELLGEDRLRREQFLDPGPVRRRWEAHLRGQGQWEHHLWGVLMFQAWLEAQRVPVAP